MSLADKVLVIGLDGASFNFINHFCRNGVMPNLGRFRERASSGDLISSYPPITPAAWTTFMTGKLPGKHHVLEFEKYRFADNSMRYYSGEDINASTLWRVVSDAGRKVAAINVPMTYPPESVNGIIVAGHNVPNPNSEYTFPRDFKKELLRVIPDYMNVKPKPGNIENPAVFDSFIKAMTATVNHYYEATKLVDSQLDWDILMTVFPHTDMGHIVWRYMDPDVSLKYPERRKRIAAIFTRLDQVLEELFDLADRRGASVVIMSDHGHGMLKGWLRPNKLLQKWGYITMANPLQWFARRMYREYQKWRYEDKYSRPARRVDEKIGIDWSRTKAVVCHTAMWGFLYLNVRGRQPQGVIKLGSEYEACRNELIERLMAEVDPQTGEKLFVDVIKPETVYGQSDTEWDSPDLLLVPQDGMKVSRRLRERWLVKHTCPDRAEGTHLLKGLWMVAGEKIKSRINFQANIQDLAPTILAAMGIAVPDDMDGRVFTEIFSEDVPVCFSESIRETSSDQPESTYTLEEEKQIQQNLADLGYLE
jgi:predicted AlkP superfamily phosphohydrolase/phosphomutase